MKDFVSEFRNHVQADDDELHFHYQLFLSVQINIKHYLFLSLAY